MAPCLKLTLLRGLAGEAAATTTLIRSGQKLHTGGRDMRVAPEWCLVHCATGKSWSTMARTAGTGRSDEGASESVRHGRLQERLLTTKGQALLSNNLPHIWSIDVPATAEPASTTRKYVTRSLAPATTSRQSHMDHRHVS